MDEGGRRRRAAAAAATGGAVAKTLEGSEWGGGGGPEGLGITNSYPGHFFFGIIPGIIPQCWDNPWDYPRVLGLSSDSWDYPRSFSRFFAMFRHAKISQNPSARAPTDEIRIDF